MPVPWQFQNKRGWYFFLADITKTAIHIHREKFVRNSQ